MVSQRGRPSLLLDLLPVELLVQILSYSDAASVGSFRAASSACKAVVDDAEQTIYEALAIRRLDALRHCTGPDTGIEAHFVPEDWTALHEAGSGSAEQVHHATANPTHGVQRAISRLRTASVAYDSVKTWREYVKQRTLAERRWKSEIPARYSLRIDEIGSAAVWRFKICPFSRLAFISTPALFTLSAGLVFSSPAPGFWSEKATSLLTLRKVTRGYTHIEYTCGYLVYADRHVVHVFQCDMSDEAFQFEPKHVIRPPTDVGSYKARYPYLLASSSTANKLYLFDLRTGQLAFDYETAACTRCYVELDQWSLFTADFNLRIYNRSNGFNYSIFPEGAGDGPTYELYSTQWTAVHHSLDGRHYLAVGDANELVWIKDYRSILKPEDGDIDQVKRAANTVVLRLDEHPGEIMIDNLCVENNRVVFSTRTSSYPVVYLFELIGWDDISLFKHQAPTLRILTGGMPSGIDGISRIEMDSTCIYITGSEQQAFRDTPDFEDVHPSDKELSWWRLDGTHIAEATVKSIWPASSPAQKYNCREFSSEHGIYLNEAIMCYDFGREPQEQGAWEEDAEDLSEEDMFQVTDEEYA